MSVARIAVVGAGWWSSTAHLPAVAANPRAELVAVCDPDPLRAETAAAAFGGAPYSDIDAVLAEARPDGVIVATPHTTHFALASAALSANCAVLVEKPLATTAADAWALVALARRRALLLATGLTYQYAAAAPFVREAVQQKIGELRAVNAEFSSSTEALFATVDPANANLEDPSAPHGTTYSDPRTGGGQAHTQLSHLLGGVLWAAGRQATEVSAFTASHGLAVDLVDALAFRLEGGALVAASSTGTTPASVPVRHRIRFHGTAGMLEWDMLGAHATLHSDNGTAERVENPHHLPAYGSARVSESFVASILDGTPPTAPGEAAAASVSLIEATLLAAATGKRQGVAQDPEGLFGRGAA